MDKKLQLIQHLYGEAEGTEPLQDLLSDNDLKQEYQELNEAKFWMDHAKPSRPDQSVIDNILAAASGMEVQDQEGSASTSVPNINSTFTPTPSRVEQKFTDRKFEDRAPASRKPKARKRRWGPVVAVLSLVAVVGIGYPLFQSSNFLQQENAPASIAGDATQALDATEPAAQLPMEARSDESFAAKSANGLSVAAEAELATSPGMLASQQNVADTSLPNWNDDMDNLIRFQKRIEMLLEQNEDLNWDQTIIPLETLPGRQPANPALQQTGSKKN